MGKLHALEAVGLFFQMRAEHAEHAASTVFTCGGVFAVLVLNDVAVNGGIRDGVT